jgi:hypothetical protein
MSDLRLVASQRTIDMISTAAATDEQYALLLQHIARGRPDSPAAVPCEIREYLNFADELTSSAGLAYKGQRVIVPRAVRQEILDRLHGSHLGINSTIRRARCCFLSWSNQGHKANDQSLISLSGCGVWDPDV